MNTTSTLHGHEMDEQDTRSECALPLPNGDYDSVNTQEIAIAAINVLQEEVRYDLPNLDYCN